MTSKPRQGAATLLVLLAVLVVVAFGLALTNPTREEHQRALQARLAEISRGQTQSQGLLDALATTLIDEVSMRTFVAGTEYRNYVLFSKTTAKGSVVTFGIARNVVVKD